ncbi:Formate/nitrite transporter [Leptodontidium sp. 2 PMI_412]|nr:Formate/nitrite transporter [Leptodontidium sp. 2 PMI_412]
MLSGLLLEDAVLYNATRKVINPPDKQLFLALLAGIWVGLGGLTAVSMAGGVPEDVRARWPSLPKLLNGAFFAFGLHFIMMFGGDLFTGNTMILAIGFYNQFVAASMLLLNLMLVYVGNWAGCLLVAYFLGYLTGLFDDQRYRSYLDEVVLLKLEELNWVEIFLRAIPANMMVCMAFLLGIASRGAAGKFLALWFPVVMFVVCGFEHCVANIFFVSLGLMYGAPSTIGRLWYNQSAAVLGNMVGGVIFIGLASHLMNHWKSPFFSSSNVGTFLAHDLESTRRAREAKDLEAGLPGSEVSTRHT